MRLKITKNSEETNLKLKSHRTLKNKVKKNIIDVIKRSAQPVEVVKKALRSVDDEDVDLNGNGPVTEQVDDFNFDDMCFRKPSATDSLSKSQRKRVKKKTALLNRVALRAKRPEKIDEEPPVSSSLVLPTPKGFVSRLDSDEAKLNAARTRLNEMYSHVLKIQPIPRPCPPGLLKDLCPLASKVLIPNKSGARYAFLQFRNQMELEIGQKHLSDKRLNRKPLKVTLSSNQPRSEPNTGSPLGGKSNEWCSPMMRPMSDFDWSTIVVKHLNRATTRLDLGQLFRRASKLRMSTYNDGSCSGSCKLIYNNPLDALQAFETRHGSFVRGAPISVNFALKNKKPPKPLPKKPLISETTPDSSSDVEMDNIEATSSESSSSDSEEYEELETKGSPGSKQAPPQLLNEYQLKRKGGPPRTSATNALLRPPASKPKRAKRLAKKPKTKRGKASKHR